MKETVLKILKEQIGIHQYGYLNGNAELTGIEDAADLLVQLLEDRVKATAYNEFHDVAELKELHRANVHVINEMDKQIGRLRSFVTEVSEAYREAADSGITLTDIAEQFAAKAKELIIETNPETITVTIKTAYGDPFEAKVLYMADIIRAVVDRFHLVCVNGDLIINERNGKYYHPYKGNLSALCSRRFADGEWVIVTEEGGAV